MDFDHYKNNADFIKDMKTLSYETRAQMMTNGAYRLHGPNPVKGTERKQILALLWGIQWSIVEQGKTNPVIYAKAQKDFEKIKNALKEEA